MSPRSRGGGPWPGRAGCQSRYAHGQVPRFCSLTLRSQCPVRHPQMHRQPRPFRPSSRLYAGRGRWEGWCRGCGAAVGSPMSAPPLLAATAPLSLSLPVPGVHTDGLTLAGHVSLTWHVFRAQPTVVGLGFVPSWADVHRTSTPHCVGVCSSLCIPRAVPTSGAHGDAAVDVWVQACASSVRAHTHPVKCLPFRGLLLSCPRTPRPPPCGFQLLATLM